MLITKKFKKFFSTFVFYDQFITYIFDGRVVRVSRRESLNNTFSSSEFRDYLVKHILEIVNLTKDYGGLARNSDSYPINMDVYNESVNKYEFRAKSNKSFWILNSLTGKTVPMNVINIDIVDSSERIKSISSKKVEYYYKAFIEKTAELIEQFGGFVLKNVGDCVIGFFPSGDSIKENHDSVVLCGLSALDMIKNMNSDFQEKGLPPIKCRVSADFGEARAVQINSRGNYSTLDLFGNALNKPTKILHHAKPDQMVIGGDLFANFMSDFREGMRKKFLQISSDDFGFDFKLIHRFDITGHENYPVFLVKRTQ